MANATTVLDMFSPTVLADAVTEGLPGMRVLAGSGAVQMNFTMTSTSPGTKLSIPMLNNIGPMEELPLDEINPLDATDVAPASMTGLTATEDEGIVRHGAKMFGATQWAQMTASYADVYQEGARQVVESIQQGAEIALVKELNTSANPLVYNIYNATTPVVPGWKDITRARSMFGDEQSGLVGVVVHSNVLFALLEETDANNNPFITDFDGENGTARLINGPLVMTSDLMPIQDNGADPPTYTSFLLKKNSILWWGNRSPRILTDTDISRDLDAIAAHLYYVTHVHRYLPGKTKPGVVKVLHNAPEL